MEGGAEAVRCSLIFARRRSGQLEALLFIWFMPFNWLKFKPFSHNIPIRRTAYWKSDSYTGSIFKWGYMKYRKVTVNPIASSSKHILFGCVDRWQSIFVLSRGKILFTQISGMCLVSPMNFHDGIHLDLTNSFPKKKIKKKVYC